MSDCGLAGHLCERGYTNGAVRRVPQFGREGPRSVVLVGRNPALHTVGLAGSVVRAVARACSFHRCWTFVRMFCVFRRLVAGNPPAQFIVTIVAHTALVGMGWYG
eukprot:3469286-Rhodomonas_salina.1